MDDFNRRSIEKIQLFIFCSVSSNGFLVPDAYGSKTLGTILDHLFLLVLSFLLEALRFTPWTPEPTREDSPFHYYVEMA